MTTLVFEKNSMLNTTILCNSSPSPAYTVSTRWPTSPTNIRAANTDELVGRINPRTFMPDTIMLPHAYGGEELRVSKWLKREKLGDGSPASVLSLGEERRFLVVHKEYGLALLAADTKTILAHWRPETSSSRLALIISHGLEKFETEILVAFLFEEGRLRSGKGNNSGGVASAISGALMGESVL
ncbi:Peptide methionine sulfoxide reductase [Mycena venus]|uniref:Peptide methionine sulfoxide reductase n=1 Tax=Mycena venus TaxID=2733690 RepID=A0A8H7CD86_9AGAR|nr:Peptide methionine sulfoxide reductase [Mycena venus]